MIEIRNLKRNFRVGDQEIQVLKDISFKIEPGTFNLLLGPSGSGKTTLLNILGTLDQASEGEVFLLGQDLSKMGESMKDRLRKESLGYIFQSVALMSNLTAYENIDFFLRINGYERKKRDERILECLRFVGLEKRMHHYPSELSGGEQQRVAIARSIAHHPKLILADEPTAELDTATGLKVVAMFKELVQHYKTTIIMCTHDLSLKTYADHIFEMEDGVILDVK